MKRSYEAPAVRVVGSVRALTLAAAVGDQTDEAFPANTPFADLTFS